MCVCSFCVEFCCLIAQVANLERQLATADRRSNALEARQELLQKELVEAEGGEVRISFSSPHLIHNTVALFL